ncbi:MAG: N-acetyltransferase [Saprospiraceae bacterium]|nr:N-acetyltransferase [Saprospiraceae bacterium]
MIITIRPMVAEDYPSVANIYEEGIATGNATFQTQAPNWTTWDKEHLDFGRLVAANTEGVIGWAALVPVSGRCVYAGVAELSVYVAANTRGLGVGRLLMEKLIEESEAHGLWTLQAGIFPENEGSVCLHETMGFRRIGYRERVGQMSDGRWRNTLLFERRSKVVGH